MASSFSAVTDKPTLAITFRNNNGLESYWDYTSSSAGRAGTGYVNDFTGNLVWIRNDIGFGGNRMPVSIQHVYNANDNTVPTDSNNSNDTGGNYFGLGNGWRTNYHQRVYQWSENSQYYVWEDSDGTDHYFLYKSTNTYEDEDGLELTLTTGGSGNSTYKITDKDSNTSYFDSYGRLVKLENNQATKSSINITYTTTSGPLISTIKDGINRVYSFTYTSNLLTRISFKGSNNTEHSYVTFGYSGTNLTRVTDKDDKYSSYGYNGNILTTASDIDGYLLTYSYNTPDTFQPYRVTGVAESHNNTAGGTLAIEYAHNQTTFKDHNNNVIIKQFNDFGNTVSIQDTEGHAQYAQYAFNTAAEKEANTDTTKKSNQLRLASNMQNTVDNILPHSSFETGHYWYSNSTDYLTVARSTEAAYKGSYSFKLVSTTEDNVAAIRSSYDIAPGETWTFSVYVRSVDASGLIALYSSTTKALYTGAHYTAGQDWTRLQKTYTNTTDQTQKISCCVFTTTPGTAYIDCVQFEKSPTASRFNLIENGGFSYTGSPVCSWTGSGLSSTDVRTTVTQKPPGQWDSNVFQITGSPTASKRLSQTVNISGAKDDTLILTGWAKGDSAPIKDNRTFGMTATFNYTDGTTSDPFEVSFNPDSDSSINWQYAAIPIVAGKAYNSVTVKLCYDYNVNTAYFDGIQLYKEEFGSSYTYDEDGNVTSVVDLQKQKTTYEYSNNNLTKMVMPTGAAYSYVYDNYHNVKTATSAENLVYNFTYDAYGNNTQVSITGGGSTISSSAVYSNSGNTLASTTDALGKVTTYGYNAQTNVLEWVQYPEDTEATRTNYTYDSMWRIATAAVTTDTNLSMSASYTYTNDLLSKIQTPTTAYNFTYGNFGLRTNVSVGTQNLATYSYTDDQNFYLQSLDYGNGDSVDYTYDSQGRLTSQTYEDGDTVTYQYDNDGALATVVDSATGITTKYYYDFTGRTMKYTETATGYSHSVEYDYDDINNLTEQVEIINGTSHTTTYDYDEDNRVKTKTTDGITVEYTYDGLGRVTQQVTKNGSTTILTESYTYTANSSQVASYTTTASDYSDTYTYTYDDNGNILCIEDQSGYMTQYNYDSANQLIEEYNELAERTWFWTYDNGGNIASYTENDYTHSMLGSILSSNSYTYGNSQWKDELTAYNGTEIQRDRIGNPEDDGTWTYTWEHGRELTSMSNGTDTWSYTYNADGIRTERTNGTRSYEYIYNGSQLVQLNVDGNALYFTYDAQGSPATVTFNGATYYYVTNLQGDVTSIVDGSGNVKVFCIYNAYGQRLRLSGSMASSLGLYNPFWYRGYVYDSETGLYYLQSRYYDPEIGRFINADGLVTTGQGFIGNNMFAYCGNNSVNNIDPLGACYYNAKGQWCHDNWEYLSGYERKPDPGYYAGTTSSGTNIYVAPNTNYILRNVDVKVIDMRDTHIDSTTKEHDPDVKIIDSYAITSSKERNEIIEILQKYNIANPSTYAWNRSSESLKVEWDAHNDIYRAYPNERCQHVDFNTLDEGVSYGAFWVRAVTSKLEEWWHYIF